MVIDSTVFFDLLAKKEKKGKKDVLNAVFF